MCWAHGGRNVIRCQTDFFMRGVRAELPENNSWLVRRLARDHALGCIGVVVLAINSIVEFHAGQALDARKSSDFEHENLICGVWIAFCGAFCRGR